MITPPETMFIILGVLLINGLITCYAVYLLDDRLRKLEELNSEKHKKDFNLEYEGMK